MPDLREHLALLLGLAPGAVPTGRITYELRRLRLHGIIERIGGSYRYQVTGRGLREALFLLRTHMRLFRSGLSDLGDPLATPSPIRAKLSALDAAIDRHLEENALAA